VSVDIRHIHPEDVPPPGGPYTPVAIAGGFVYVCGQIPRDAEGNLAGEDFESQARQVFANMERSLAAAGATFADVVKVNGYLKDFAGDFAAFNQIYRETFSEPFPVRTTVPSELTSIKIEVECIAYIGD
jgi:2-iminobutanoate/2-iminopropanoate deaminase